MKLRSLAVAVIGMAAALAAPAVAHAYASYTTGDVNQRTGPSTGYHRVGVLGAGSRVDVSYCQPGWCRVNSYLGPGWVSSRYLSTARTYRPRTYAPRVYPRPYPYYPYYGYRRPYPYPYYGYPRSGFSLYFRWP